MGIIESPNAWKPHVGMRAPGIFISIIKTCGQGITMHRAALTIIIEVQAISADEDQAFSRHHRHGQKYSIVHGCALQDIVAVEEERAIISKLFRQILGEADEGAHAILQYTLLVGNVATGSR
ncbi:hypothetical protein BO83DRAFT_385371 [Aspergillus eucalypticola CBS 122712]|uniref:Uncharacterized protein n=1 Tax=Aspergillus eucalypticola (strain CBS 122712 / IBT 29274) TaxID=1448314 RepID=A0A317WEX8_ASPEC|nr:uncharacterized protein BO83DRAFT_385371 [Aspergillus eucalypticola CBS 122712]PWY82780.1 hypothetical protein BO83DRAFT_385371 [Aspergillus eucalypticola CBS 122712]